MLPFLDKKKIAASIIEHRKPTGELESTHEDTPHMTHAHDLISAIHAKDPAKVMQAMQGLMKVSNATDEE